MCAMMATADAAYDTQVSCKTINPKSSHQKEFFFFSSLFIESMREDGC